MTQRWPFFFTYITNYEKYNLCISFADGNGRTVLHLRIKPWSGILNTVLNPPLSYMEGVVSLMGSLIYTVHQSTRYWCSMCETDFKRIGRNGESEVKNQQNHRYIRPTSLK